MVPFTTTPISSLLSIFLFISTPTNGYHLSLTPLDWTSANTYCQSRCDSTLASINTVKQYFIAKEILSNNQITDPVWTGLNKKNDDDDTVSKTFTWIDGSGSINDTNPLWGISQPDTSITSNNCVAMKGNDSQWYNEDCDTKKYRFLCNSCEGGKHGVINKQYSPSLDTQYSTKSDAENACNNRMAELNTYFDGEEAKATLGYSDTANAWINPDQCQQINGGVTDECKKETPITSDQCKEEFGQVTDVSCNTATEAPVLCSIQSEICKPKNQWEIQGSGSMTFDNECGLSIESQDDNTIVGLTNKEWKTCTDKKPFVAEMKYRTRSPGQKSRTGLVFYPHGASNPYDHYYVRIHPVHKKVYIGYEHNNKENTLVEASFNGLDIHLQDMTWETLRVEIYFGFLFVVRINGIAVIPSAVVIHDELNAASNGVMSGYVGIQSKYGSIDVASLYASGMEVYYDSTEPAERQLLKEWMQQCQFDPADDVELDFFDTLSTTTTSTTQSPATTTITTSSITSSQTAAATTTTSTTSSTTTTPTTSASTTSTTSETTASTSPVITTSSSTTTTAQSTSSSINADGTQSGNGDNTATDSQPQTDNGGDIIINADEEEGNDAFVTGADDDTFVIPALYIYVPIAAGVLCCMIIVGIYYCRLKTQRNKKREMEGIFGRQSISMSTSNASSQRQRELATVVREAMSHERGNNQMDANDVELELEGSEIANDSHGRTSSTVWNDNRLYHKDNNPQRQDVRDSVILNTWDVEALEMDCNDMIKNNKIPKRFRSRAYSE